MSEEPEYGPRGYLPERAAKRARKIVLRSPLGLQWVVGAVLAGAVVIVAGILFLSRAGGPPAEPFVPVATIDEVGDALLLDDRGVLVVGAVGRIRAFVVGELEAAPLWCETSRHIESPAGRVWAPTGRALDGEPSLDQHPVVVVDGTVYLDPTEVVPGPPPDDTGAAPTCH